MPMGAKPTLPYKILIVAAKEEKKEKYYLLCFKYVDMHPNSSLYVHRCWVNYPDRGPQKLEMEHLEKTHTHCHPGKLGEEGIVH